MQALLKIGVTTVFLDSSGADLRHADRPGDLDGAHDKGNMPFEDEPPQIRNELEAVRSKAA